MRKVERVSRLFLVMVVLVLLVGLPVLSHGQSSTIDPKANQILRKMCDYVAGLKQFRVHTENSLEAILLSGEKIQFDSPASLLVSRPNKLRADRKGDIVDQEFYYDGKTLTLYNPDKKVYATVNAPPTLEETPDFGREVLDIYAPGADFIYKTAYDRLMQDVVSGLYIGMSMFRGIPCHHLAFRGKEIDWQVWIQDGEKPLPRKYVITSKWMAGAPQFTLLVKGWSLSPKLSEDMFTFTPPKDAKKIDFIRPSSGGMSQR